jgi:hypothetical protein
MVRRADLGGASIGFRELDGVWTLTPERKPLRTVTRALLAEVSIVHRGAYSRATVAARSVPRLTRAEITRQFEAREARGRELEATARELGVKPARPAPTAVDGRPLHPEFVRVGDSYLVRGRTKGGGR